MEVDSHRNVVLSAWLKIKLLCETEKGFKFSVYKEMAVFKMAAQVVVHVNGFSSRSAPWASPLIKMH